MKFHLKEIFEIFEYSRLSCHSGAKVTWSQPSMLGWGSLLHRLQPEPTFAWGIPKCIQHSFCGCILALSDLHNSFSKWGAKTAQTAHENKQNYQQPQFIHSEFSRSLIHFFTYISSQMFVLNTAALNCVSHSFTDLQTFSLKIFKSLFMLS